jgi:hypothetical protein
MERTELITNLQANVKKEVETYLSQRPLVEVASLDEMESLCRTLFAELVVVFFEVWSVVLDKVAKELALTCPGCGARRKCKRRSGALMVVKILGLEIAVPKLYLECARCAAPGLSVTKVLTGLQSGDASIELKLMAAYSAAKDSYGKAAWDHKAHHGQELERTAVRRLALEVEDSAKSFAAVTRAAALQKVSGEAKTIGVCRLMVQGDGGSVRTGKLAPCDPGDKGYGKATAKTGKPRRKRVTQNREVITFDVREPGQLEPKGLDVVVPCEASYGQRAQRMLATAARSGLGDNTQVLGLGDLGSRLPESFDEAFVGYDSIYSSDWNHVRKYVEGAKAVLEDCEGATNNKGCEGEPEGFDSQRWQQQMLESIWRRDEQSRDRLLEQSYQHRVEELPESYERCPVRALSSYMRNNWNRMNAALYKQMDVDFVSARAEAQVRERTKRRFSVPGAWRQENLEGKATLRAIIDEGSWERFCHWYRNCSMTLFQQQLVERLERAKSEGRISAFQVIKVFGNDQTHAEIFEQAA